MVSPHKVDPGVIKSYKDIIKAPFPKSWRDRPDQREYNLISTIDKHKQIKFQEKYSTPSLPDHSRIKARFRGQMAHKNFQTLDAALARKKVSEAGAGVQLALRGPE